MNDLTQQIKSTPLAEGQIGIWYLGQEGFIIKKDGKYIAVDLYLSDYVDRNCCQYVKWERLYPAPCKAEELDFIDTVVCTHTHYDHADPDTLSVLARVNEKAKFIIPAPECDTVTSYGIEKSRIIPAYADKKLMTDGFEVTPIPSAHETFHTDESGNFKELGYIIDAGCARVFHAGDMCMYDGLEERLSDIDIAMLPINGRDYFRNRNDIIGNFDPVEAILLAKSVGADVIVPMHHDLYAVNRVSPAYFVDCIMNNDPMRKYKIFAPGEKMIYSR